MAIGFSIAPKKFGEAPHSDMDDIYQGYFDTCAIRSQEIILRDFGIDVSQEELIATAMQHDWYRPGYGTSMKDVGNLLDHYGIPVNQYEEANVFNLANELAQGRKVIVAVDAPELYGKTDSQHDLLEEFGHKTPNHALIVSGIDTRDINNIKITLTDPGTGDVSKIYSWDEFVNAWEDSNCFMVSTSVPVPKIRPEMQNFDFERGHVSQIGNMDYERFVEAYSHYMGLSYKSPEYQEAVNRFSDEQGWIQPTGTIEGTTYQSLDTSEVEDAISLPDVIDVRDEDSGYKPLSKLPDDIDNFGDEISTDAIDQDTSSLFN